MKRLISLLCTLALVLTMVGPAMTAFAVGEEEGRVIDIVYDDSGSMEVDNRWSQALYAMEVFAAMLGDEDEMNVYCMSDEGRAPVEVEGDDPDRVEKLVTALDDSGNTPFNTVRAAAADILAEAPEKDRWLVILTDGVFQNGPSSGVQAQLEEYARQGVKVYYLALTSDESIKLTEDTSIGLYAEFAADSSQILPQITKMANQIFQQQVMPASHIAVSGNTVTVDADIPLDQILIFAQGDGVSVSGMALSGTAMTATESHQVEVTDANAPSASAHADDGLRGAIQTYTAGSTPFASGTWEFTCSDTSNLEIYYIAGADIDCHLTYNGVEVKNDEKHYAGEYGVSMRFIDPLTGDELTSDLLDGAVFTAEVINGADVQTIDASTSSIRLGQGDIQLNAWAELPGHVTVSSSHQYTVYPEPILLDISAQLPGGGYKLSALGENAEPILLTVSSQATGEKLSQEEWDAADLTVSCPANINWLVRKGSEVGTWELRPDYVTDMSDTDTGALELAVKVEYEIGTQAASGAAVLSVSIMDYVSSELKVDIAPSVESIRLNDLANTDGALVSVYTKDEYTGEYNPLTAEQSKALSLTVEAEALNWELTAGPDAGTWYLKPKDDTAALAYSDDTVVVIVSGELADGALLYQGSDSEALEVVPLTLLEKLMRVIGYVVAGAAVLLLFIGYVGKKKLSLKNIEPYVENVATRPRKRLNVKYKKIWWSYLLPYVPQRATFVCHQPVFNCKFANVTIKAAGGTFFYITNIKAFVGRNTKIDGEFVDAKADKKKKYNMSSTISSHDAKTKRPSGEFHFV